MSVVADRRREWTLAVVQFALVGALVVGAVALAHDSVPIAVVMVAGAGLAAVLAIGGIEAAATVVLGLAIFLSPMNAVRPIGGVVTASDMALVVGFLLLAPLLVTRRLQLPASFVAGHLVLGVTGLVVSMTAADAAISFNFLFRLIAGALVLPLVFVWWCPPMRTIRGLAWAYVLGSAFSLVWGYVVTGPVNGRYLGLTSHPNALGMTAMIAVAFSLFLLRESRPGGRAWAFVAVGVSLAGVLVSGSRASLLVAGMVVVLYPLMTRSITAGVVIGLGGVLAVARLGVVPQETTDGNALSRLFGGGAASASDLERQEALRIALVELRERPFLGGGFEQALAAHDIYLQVAVSVGVIGLIGYLLVVWGFLRPFATSDVSRALVLLPALAYFVVGLLSNILWDRYVWCALAVSLAGWISQERARSSSEVPADVPVAAR